MVHGTQAECAVGFKPVDVGLAARPAHRHLRAAFERRSASTPTSSTPTTRSGAGVSLIDVSNGIDRSAHGATMNFVRRSLLAEMFVDESGDEGACR